MIWLLHGNLGQVSDWRLIRNIIADKGCETRAIDLWMFLECCGMGLEDVGRALYEEIKRVDDHPILVGYSMGGRLALQAIAHDPAFWKAAVFLSTHPGLVSKKERAARLKRDTEWSVMLKREESFEEFLEKWDSQDVLKGDALPGRLALVSRKTALSRAFIHWSLGNQQNFLPIVAQWPLLMKWMAGAKDEKFKELAKKSASMCDRAQSHIVPNVGHRLLFEAPEIVAEEILSLV